MSENNRKSENANMDSSTGKNSLSSNPVNHTIIHNDKTYYVHHIHDNYGASKDGSIINLERKETDIGTLYRFGRYYFQAAKKFKPGEKRYYQKRNFYYNHRLFMKLSHNNHFQVITLLGTIVVIF